VEPAWSPLVTSGVFPGTFNPPTIAHLAIAEAARRTYRLGRLDLVVSRVPLGKDEVSIPSLDERITVLRSITRRLPWLGVVVSDSQLIADLATGYDVVVMGADKWQQIHDVAFYDGSPVARDEAIASLPRIAVVPRSGFEAPADLLLDLGEAHLSISSSRARNGEIGLMAPEARASGLWAP